MLDSPVHQGPIQPLIAHLTAKGISAKGIELVATVALLPAGERTHYTDQRVKVFHPVSVQLDFVQLDTEKLVAGARFDAPSVKRKKDSSLLDQQHFDRHVRLDGALADAETSAPVVGLLMRELVDKHREITGQVSSAFEHIETDPQVIDQITAKRFQLKIGLERLARYIALDDEWFDLLIEGDDPRAERRIKQLNFEKLMLQEGFIQQPCSQGLYEELRAEFVSEGYLVGMQFMDYYQWFRRSEALFDDAGRITGDTRAEMERVITDWHATDKDKATFRENTCYWVCRNFEIHPRHREAVGCFIDEVASQLSAGKVRESSPRP